MRIAISTDCWFPQINGITLTIEATAAELRTLGHDVLLLTPEDFGKVRLPYQDMLVLASYPRLGRLMRRFAPDTVLIATQGLLGLCVRLWCRRHRAHAMTMFHTRFPEYARIRYGLSERLLYLYAQVFHGRTAPVLVPSHWLAEHLRMRGIANARVWGRGVDLDRFRPRPKTWSQYRRPIQLYVGRVVAEKNVEAFLRVEVPGTKLVVGEGALVDGLRMKYPDAVFLGPLQAEELDRCYAEADVLVFPSLLDTFGLVVLEALASGVPVAALPSPHLAEIFGADQVIACDDNLAKAVSKALTIPSDRCRAVAMRFSWRAATEQLVAAIESDRLVRGYGDRLRVARSGA